MQFCISITDKKALEKWLSIPSQKRSKYVQEMLLREGDQEELIKKIKEAFREIGINSTSKESNVNFDTALIDEILNL